MTWNSFDPLKFTIVFWFYLENTAWINLVSLRDHYNQSRFDIVVRQGR